MKILSGLAFVFAVLAPTTYAVGQNTIANCTPERVEKGENARLLFADRQKPVVLEEQLTKIGNGYIKYQGSMQIPGEDSLTFDYQYYQTTRVKPGEKAPVLFLYASIFGISPMEQTIAHYFARRGISVVVTHYMDNENVYVLENYILSLLNTVRVSLALVDHFSERPENDASQMGVMGASYGGLRGLYHLAMDSRVKAGVLMVIGAPIEEVMASSELPAMAMIRHEQMSRAGVSTIEEYLKILKSQMIVDVGDLLCHRKMEDFYLFISDNDRAVHSRYQWNLWNILNGPRYESRLYGHAGTAIWASLVYLSEARRFFEARWGRATLNEDPSSTPEPIE